MKPILPMLMISFAIFLTGCASHQVTGFTDPGYQTVKYDSAIVYANDAGLRAAGALETSMCTALIREDVRCRSFQEEFAPTRVHALDETLGVLDENGIGALVVLSHLSDFPEGGDLMYRTVGGPIALGDEVLVSPRSDAGDSFSNAHVFRITVLDTSSGHVSWIGEVDVGPERPVSDSHYDSLWPTVGDAMTEDGPF